MPTAGQTPPRTEDDDGAQRLESWKEIAAYLKRGITTVQRWEKHEGLPVHRHLHDKLGTVYALKGEIDTWFRSRGEQLETEEPTTETAPPRVGKWLILASICTLLVGISTATYFMRGRFSTTGKPMQGRVMLAVLPFADLSGLSDQDALVDGMTEEMIGQLGILDAKRLGVIARTSVMRYKRSRQDIKQIGRELGVDYVVEGSVRRDKDQVRVHAQLIRVSDQTSIWAQNYDKEFGGVLALETEIAGQIAHSLRVELIPAQSSLLLRNSTTNTEAHEDFLMGSYQFNKGTVEGLSSSVSKFQDAVAKDPKFALAYAGLADSYNLLGSYGVLAPNEAFPKAKEAANKALALDDKLAEAHNALALATFYYDWNWAGAEEEFQRAIASNPGYARAHHWYAWYLSLMSRHAEAIQEVRQAEELDPFSPQINMDIGSFYYRARRFDDAIAQFRKTLTLEPHFEQAYVGLARTYMQKGDYAEALAEIREAMSRQGANSKELATLDESSPVIAIRNLRRMSIEKLKKTAMQNHTTPYALAELYTLIGDNDRAMEWLNRGYAEHSHAMVFLKVEPTFDPLRADPRFEALLRSIRSSQ